MSRPRSADLDGAFAALSADELREVVRVASVDEYLRRGSVEFLRGKYNSANRIFGTLLPAISDGSIDLGQRELVDEVLGSNVAECAARYIVSAYMTAPAAERAEAVWTAIDRVRDNGLLWEPLREMERVAAVPLPDLQDFLPRWREIIASKSAADRRNEGSTGQDRWLREVVQRLEGAEGLAKVARSTKQTADLRAWCQCLVDAADWKAALPAFEEAADLVAENYAVRGELLDGAALAAHMLGREDLAAYLERAWRAIPSGLRLRRWLGSSNSKATLAERVAEALAACPTRATSQRALLHLLAHDFASAAKLLASSSGLGWSDGEHPGHLLFPLFAMLLEGRRTSSPRRPEPLSFHGLELAQLDVLAAVQEKPRLPTPEREVLLALAGVDRISDAATRTLVLAAMKSAAEHRVAGVTEQKRRRHYSHAADLIAICIACDASSETLRWTAGLQAEYRSFPALRRELDRAIEAP